jgi:hypothetical protein
MNSRDLIAGAVLQTNGSGVIHIAGAKRSFHTLSNHRLWIRARLPKAIRRTACRCTPNGSYCRETVGFISDARRRHLAMH